jgi:hypothetical protein
MTRLEKALAVLATVSPADLPERWAEVSTGTAPSVPTPLLLQLLAQRLQEKRHGGLPLMVVRELERVVSVGRPMPEPARKTIVLTPGTRLTPSRKVGFWALARSVERRRGRELCGDVRG